MMNRNCRIGITGLALVFLVLLAGCSGPESTPAEQPAEEIIVPTPAAPPVETAVVPAEPVVTPEVLPPSIWDEPVSQPPADISVSITVAKDQIFNTITATFNGGFGQGLVSDIEVRVIMSDGRDEIQKLLPEMGNSVDFVGTSHKDEVMVAVWYKNGQSYKISDDFIGFGPV
ncbi:MAG: hypothetical protein JXA44_09865 [Methanospirillaceae archaeon]|nr:hypothetical protein [Methanospirillaceae archaeon]